MASKGQLRTPNRRVGLAGKLQTEFGSPIVSPHTGSPYGFPQTSALKKETHENKPLTQSITDVDKRDDDHHNDKDDDDSDDDAMTDQSCESSHGARVRRKPQLPGADNHSSHEQDRQSANEQDLQEPQQENHQQVIELMSIKPKPMSEDDGENDEEGPEMKYQESAETISTSVDE